MTTRLRPRQRSRWSLDLTGHQSIRVKTTAGSLTVTPAVDHTAHFWWPELGHGDFTAEGVRHTFDLVVAWYSFDLDDDAEGTKAKAYLLEQFAGYGLPNAPDLLTGERLVIGRLEIDELPVHHVERCGGWDDVLDGNGEEGEALARLVSDITDDDSPRHVDFALMDGSFLWPRALAIHPKLRGRRLGVRLLAHGLFALHRSDSDVAAFGVGRIQSCFDTTRERITKAQLRRFKQYYARVGFRSWPRDETIVYLPLGLRGMPVKGLGQLSNPCR